jgi:hypothetical protein
VQEGFLAYNDIEALAGQTGSRDIALDDADALFEPDESREFRRALDTVRAEVDSGHISAEPE